MSGEGAGGGGERRRRVGVGGRSTNWCGGQQPFVLVWGAAALRLGVGEGKGRYPSSLSLYSIYARCAARTYMKACSSVVTSDSMKMGVAFPEENK